jgi:hypothetical protein
MSPTTFPQCQAIATVAVALACLLPIAASAADPTPDPAEPSFSGAAQAPAIERLMPYRNR